MAQDQYSSQACESTLSHLDVRANDQYWQSELWNRLFDILLNPNTVGELPINDTLNSIRGEFEIYLEENCQKGGKSLKSMLKKIELAAITGRR